LDEALIELCFGVISKWFPIMRMVAIINQGIHDLLEKPYLYWLNIFLLVMRRIEMRMRVMIMSRKLVRTTPMLGMIIIINIICKYNSSICVPWSKTNFFGMLNQLIILLKKKQVIMATILLNFGMASTHLVK
jgi:hypothetical protein